MASPPAGSPPGHSGLALPRQRPPTLVLPTKSWRPSPAPSTGSAHPLRQTSFPPSDGGSPFNSQSQHAGEFSPGEVGSQDDFSDDADVQSAISGPVGGADEAFSRKRKRGEKRPRGRPSKNATLRASSASVVNGEDGRSSKRGTTVGAASVVTAGEGDEEDEDDEDDATGAAANVGIVDAAELEKENQNRYLFREAVNPTHQNRYDSFNKVKLRKEDVRRLVNQTLSQSVPPNVITVVQAYTKMFAGLLIEGAKEVQAEWMAARPTLADGQTVNRAYKRMRLMQPERRDDSSESEDEEDHVEDEESQKVKAEESDQVKREPGTEEETLIGDIEVKNSQEKSASGLTNGEKRKKERVAKKAKDNRDEFDEFDDLGQVQPGAWGLAKYIEEPDRGPLMPDHLRESLRRYKLSRAGGTVGFSGISLARPEVAAPRMGGKRLFR